MALLPAKQVVIKTVVVQCGWLGLIFSCIVHHKQKVCTFCGTAAEEERSERERDSQRQTHHSRATCWRWNHYNLHQSLIQAHH